MSIFAGIYSLNGEPITDQLRQGLSDVLSRNSSDIPLEYSSDGFAISFVDLQAFDPATLFDEGLTVLAGEPLGRGANRREDLLMVRQQLRGREPGALRRCDGIFAVADYDESRNVLTLTTDRLGIRPIYCFRSDHFVVFATAIRILEALPFVPKRISVRAVSEIAALGYALADRTPYEDIFVLRPGEMLTAAPGRTELSTYADWNGVSRSTATEAEELSELYDRFSTAVRRRLGRDTETIAYLSGGLDSRCVVAGLRELGATVQSFNFARKGTQDEVFGRLFAEQVEAEHHEIEKDSGDQVPDYSALLTAALGSRRTLAEHPQLAWSGEGGSVDLGHVHLGRRIVELMRADDEAAAVDEFFRREEIYISPKLLRDKTEPLDLIKNSIREELAGIKAEDPARRFYLFLLLNDQRRKLASHFESQDIHRLELQLPFFDASFVEHIISLAIDACLEHRLYVKWLSLFQPAVTSVAWQAYPGHVKCPIPVSDQLAYQWDEDYQASERASLRRKLVSQSKRMLFDRSFPSAVLNRTSLAFATLVHSTGWRDYGYVIETAKVFYDHAKRCSPVLSDHNA